MDSEPGLKVKQHREDYAKYLMMAIDGCDNPSGATVGQVPTMASRWWTSQ